MVKLAKSVVDYREAKPGEPTCGDCKVFKKFERKDRSCACDVVSGIVRAGDTCKLCAPKGVAQQEPFQEETTSDDEPRTEGGVSRAGGEGEHREGDGRDVREVARSVGQSWWKA